MDEKSLCWDAKGIQEAVKRILTEKNPLFDDISHHLENILSLKKPLCTGTGFYHIESRTSTQRWMDIVADFGREQFIVELKLWHGEKKQTDAYEQLYGYLESMHAAEGFLLTFDLREKKKIRKERISYKGKRILDLVI